MSSAPKVAGSAAPGDREERIAPQDAAWMKRALDATERLQMQRDRGSAGRLAADSLLGLLDADRAAYYLYEPGPDRIWTESDSSASGRRESPVGGISGISIRSGTQIAVAHIGEDPRADSAIDDPEAALDARLLATPLSTRKGGPLGVLLALRRAGRPEFTKQEQDRGRMLSELFAPLFEQLVLRSSAEALLAREEARAYDATPFRREALEARNLGDGALARPLQTPPRWASYTLWLLLASTLGLIAFLFLGTVTEYTEGPAVLTEGEHALPAPARDGGAPLSITAVLPGHFRPLLKKGQVAALTLTGHKSRIPGLAITSLSPRVMAPSALRSALGSETAELIPFTGPSVILTAGLPDRSFRSEGHSYALHAGMTGTVSIPLRRVRLIVQLFPALAAIPWLRTPIEGSDG